MMDKRFIGDCIKFLCRESRINSHPVNQNGFTVYNVPHYCFYTSEQEKEKQPPPYLDKDAPPVLPRRSPKHEYDYPTKPPFFPPEVTAKPLARERRKLEKLQSKSESMLQPYFQFPEGVWEDYSDSKVNGETKGIAQVSSGIKAGIFVSQSVPIMVPFDSIKREAEENSLISSMSSTTSSLGESLFLADGILSGFETSRVHGTTHSTTTEVTQATSTDVPPRNIPRAKHETSVPASGLHYYNFRPHLFQPRHRDFFMKSIPVPPRGLRSTKDAQPREESSGQTPAQSRPIPPRIQVRERESFSSLSYLSKTVSATSPLRTSQMESQSHRASVPIASLLTRTSSNHSADTIPSSDRESLSQSCTIVNSGKLSVLATTGNSSKSDDEEEPDYEYMSHYSAKSHDIDSTYPFSLIALDLSSSQHKYSAKSLLGQGSSRLSSHRSKHDEAAGRSFGSLIRTFSDTSLDHSFNKESGSKRNSPYGRRPSLAYSSATSSTSSWEEDCYVMISPTTYRKTSNERCYSPSYIRDIQLLDKIAEATSSMESSPKRKPTTQKENVTQGTQTNSNSKEAFRKERKISLTDAGHVIREDWVITLDELRREHAKIARQVEQVVKTQVSEKLDLNEIAHLEWRRQEESLTPKEGRPNTIEVFSPSDDDRRYSSQDSDESDFLHPHSSLLRKYAHSVPASPTSPLDFLPQLRPSVDRNTNKQWTIPRSSAVVSKPPVPGRKGSPGYVKSVSLPRETTKQDRKDATSSPARWNGFQNVPISSKSTLSPQYQQSRLSTPDSEGDLEYVHDFINVTSRRGAKPVPVPRARHLLKTDFGSSQQASMVTLGIFRNMSSSEGNLVEAVGRDSVNTSPWLDQSISTTDLRP